MIIHSRVKQQKDATGPTVKGYDNFIWFTNSSLAKIGWGSSSDFITWADISPSDILNGQIAYTAEIVAEASAAGALLFEYFRTLRQEIRFDLSLLRLEPILL